MSSSSQKRYNITLALLASCIAQSIYADTPTTHVETLATILVEATRTNTDYLNTPASVYRIDAPKNKNSLGVNLTEVVQGVPSLQLNNRQNYAQDLQLSMRGFGARSTFGVRGIRIYVDGIPSTMPDGQGQTSNIDLNSLDHVEVLTGAFSSLYGNSSGGTLLTTTKEGTGPDSVAVNYGGGSHGSNQSNIILQGGAKTASQPAYVISSSYFNTNGFRDHSEADKVQNNAKLTWHLDDGSKINWVTNYTKINAADPMGLTRQDWLKNAKQAVTSAYTFNTRKAVEQLQTGATWDKPLTDHQSISVMGYVGQREVTQYQSIPKATQTNPKHAGGVIDFSRNYYGTDLRWTGRDLLPKTTLNIGVAIDAMNESRKGYENFIGNQLGVLGKLRRDENNTLWNVDPYMQASWQFLPTWRLDTGVRYSNVHYESKDHYVTATNPNDSGKTKYNKVLPSAALSWQILPQLTAYASYAKGFETPTFTEMAYRTDGKSGFNFDLLASSSDNYEVGLKTDNTFGFFTLAAFQARTKNDIVSAGTLDGRATFRNADQTLREGVELSWNKKLWQDLTARASYSYLDATFNADIPAKGSLARINKGTYIPGVAKNQAYASLAWQPDMGFYTGVDVRYMDKIYVDDQNSDTAPSYVVTALNMGYRYKIKDWSLNTYARLDNVFNRHYVGSVIVNDGNGRYFEPADGRNWSAGLSITKPF
ncbi:TonB-dependent receptor [Acinetobacter boissieri]|uniref:Iron complex outermembrane recepter protein n=1 Tax=Acinetobacter boissieri TaxID=1219383 RepID=A0A1G6H8Z4_9GAMM|nr:TonB-dependent receptor [Acinetobacter boissieri]SDB90624.1 iron complex outermembrane recepter protein [Acinetobacter boissieri]